MRGRTVDGTAGADEPPHAEMAHMATAQAIRFIVHFSC
jgi:hypothetical protein